MRRVLGNLYFLTFLNGFLIASLFYFKMEANYENELFQAIHVNINSMLDASDAQDSVLLKTMHACHDLLVNRGSFFQGKQFNDFTSDLLEPSSTDLMTASGACGSFSMVLARILQGFQFEVRIAQMKSDNRYAAHNIVEAKTRHGWVVLDPMFDISFVKPSQELASFDDVKTHWNYYKNQLPASYDLRYRYEGVRYTNWTKIPIILPAIKYILDKIIGKPAADTISVRTYILRKYNICFNLVLFYFLFVFSYTLVKLIKAKVFPQKNIPVTFSNVFKYARLRLFDEGFAKQSRA